MPYLRKAIFGGLAMLALSVGLSGCSKPYASQAQTLPTQQNGITVTQCEPRVSALIDEVTQYRNKLEESEQEVERWRRQVAELEQVNETLRHSYRQALQSPGYEAVLRVVYQRLQQGDTSLLQNLLPSDRPVEAGILDKYQRTYRQYASGETIDLQQFVEWGKSRPAETGKFTVVATMPGYAWAIVDFPDGTHFRIMFSGWTVTHILATDEPIMFT